MAANAAREVRERCLRQVKARVVSGDLLMSLHREDVPLEQALAFAARHNARRGFLFVSRLLGRHIPTRPTALRQSAAALADKLVATLPRQPCIFIGMAETATTLGQAVFREFRRRGGVGLYLDTTRRRTGGPLAFSFAEEHSHSPEQLVHVPTTSEDPEAWFGRASTLVIVDDELTTGRTMAALAAAYRTYAGQPVEVHVATLVSWQGPCAAGGGFEVHSLVEGEFTFAHNAAFVPETNSSAIATVHVAPPFGTRHGVRDAQVPAWPDEAPGRVLVVGAGEFGFIPFVVAEQIERDGGVAFVQATTRSPVALGDAVQHVRRFPALSGEGYVEFLYNVPDDHSYDRVIVCVEDRLPPEGHPMRTIPRVEWRSARG